MGWFYLFLAAYVIFAVIIGPRFEWGVQAAIYVVVGIGLIWNLVDKMRKKK